MRIYLNSEAHEITKAGTIAELVEELGLPGPTLLIEHNGTALRRDEWVQQALAEDDRLEVMRIAAGG
jgi:sulfur carrier protein